MIKNFTSYINSEATLSDLPIGFPIKGLIILGFIYGFGKHLPLSDMESIGIPIFGGFFWSAGVTLWLFACYKMSSRTGK